MRLKSERRSIVKCPRRGFEFDIFYIRVLTCISCVIVVR
jgi:hypothetical protein